MSVVSKPTQGPWNLTYSNCWITGRDPERGEIVIAKMEAGTLADALQLRAAPDLLSALKGMLEVFVDSDSYAGYEDMATVKAARAAISSATVIPVI